VPLVRQGGANDGIGDRAGDCRYEGDAVVLLLTNAPNGTLLPRYPGNRTDAIAVHGRRDLAGRRCLVSI